MTRAFDAGSALRWGGRLAAAITLAAMTNPILADSTPQALPFVQDWSNLLLISTNDSWTGVPGVEGFRGDSLTTGNDVDARTVLAADDPGVIDVNANQTSTNFTTGGVSEFHLPDPVVALQGSGTATAPYLKFHVSTIGVSAVRVRYLVRDVDGSADNAPQQVALHFRVGDTGVWTNVPAAYIADATTGPNLATLTTAVDVTLPSAAGNQPLLQLRILTTNATGSDEWVGIDDLVVEPSVAPTTPTIVAASGVPSPVEWGQTLVVTAQIASGSNPASSTFAVTADASALGLAAPLDLLDNGLAPDVAAGDLRFTGQLVVNAVAGVGARALPLAVVDDLGRTGGGTLTVQVTQPVQVVPIPALQGSGATSPYVGQVVRTSGVVTARKFNGLFIQSVPGAEDGDPLTSDGVFVFTSSAPAAAFQPGDVVSVQGTVAEFVPSADPRSLPLTELTGPSFTETGTAALPAPIVLTPADVNPSGGVQQLERLEGMLVAASSLTAVSPVDGDVAEATNVVSNTGVFYAVLTGTPRPVREPGIEVLEAVPTCAAGSGCTIPVFDMNPERLRVDADAILGVTAPIVTTGAVMTDVVAVVDYGFRSYTLLPTNPLAPTGLAAATAARVPAADEFTVSSFNLERLFDTTNDPTTSDVVMAPAAYQGRLAKLSAAVRLYLHAPDVIGVQEAENLIVLQDLAARIDADAAAAGAPVPGYVAYLFEGNDIGGIDVGFLVKARVAVADVQQIGLTDTYLNPATGLPDVLNDRPSVVLRGTVTAAPGTLPAPVIVVVHHLRSLNGLTEVPGGARVRAKRQAQGEDVATLLASLQSTHPGTPIVSVGDYNAFEVNDGFVDVLGIARGAPAPASDVVNFSGDLLTPDFALAGEVAGTAPDQTYSYSFDGNAQSLDHVLVSVDAAARLAAFDHARINADFPELYRGDLSRVERTSDHDPAVAYFRFPRDTTPPTVTVPSDQQAEAQGPAGAVVSWTATASDDIDGALPVTCAPASGGLFPFGVTVVSCSATDAAGNVGTAAFAVTVRDPATSGLLAGATVHGVGPAAARVILTAVRTSRGDTGAAVLATGRSDGGAPFLFAATRIAAVAFFNDPSSLPGVYPASGVDTTRVAGAGVWNGRAGYTFELVATDRGEPGRGRDAVSLTVRDASGAPVLYVTGTIDGGNVDSLPIW